jgi:hypothetical protein
VKIRRDVAFAAKAIDRIEARGPRGRYAWMSAKGQKRTITAPIEFVRFVPETPHPSIVWTSIGATVNYPQQYRPSRRAERCLAAASTKRRPRSLGGTLPPEPQWERRIYAYSVFFLRPLIYLKKRAGERLAERNSLRQNLGVALRIVYGSGSDIGEAALRHKQVEADRRRGDFRASIELRKAAED